MVCKLFQTLFFQYLIHCFLCSDSLVPSTPCREELGDEQRLDGRYLRLIQNAFSEGTIRIKYPNRNLFCRCFNPTWMQCSIWLKTLSHEFGVVSRKLDRTNPEAMFPFRLYTSVDNEDEDMNQSIVYSYPFRQPPVYAAMRVEIVPPNWPSDPVPQPRDRTPADQIRGGTQSAMGQFHYPDKVIPLKLCTDGQNTGCPITTTEFEVGQYVYIIKDDIQKVGEGKCVPCISAEGLRKLANTMQSRLQMGFVDPFRRRDGALMSIAADYEAYLIGPSSDVGEPSEEREERLSLGAPSETGGMLCFFMFVFFMFCFYIHTSQQDFKLNLHIELLNDSL